MGKHGTAQYCVDLYIALLRGLLCVSIDHECVEAQERCLKYTREHLGELKGKDLACWCRLDKPCHADVLLLAANREQPYGPLERPD